MIKLIIYSFFILLLITGLYEIFSPSLDKTSEGDYLLYYNDIFMKNKEFNKKFVRKYIKLF